MVSKKKINEYTTLELKFQSDSLRLDSLKEEYYSASDNAALSEKTADYYKDKYMASKNKMNYLQTHIIDIKGDSLLISLSKKIN